ncbi:hypothetical protein BT69DRAFT_1228424, partial [Atractiella rhizophila]
MKEKGSERVAAILSAIQFGDSNRRNLEPGQLQQLKDLVTEYQDVFALGLDDMEPTTLVEHQIPLKSGAVPHLSTSSPPMTPPQRKWVYDKIEKLIQSKVV